MTTSPQLPADLFVQPFNDCVLLETIEHLQRQLSLSLAWQRIRVSVELPAGEKAGLCANILLCDPLAFQPFPVQFHANAQKRLQQDTALQESIAHAYWQTCWASGAIRASRGETEPVAFVAVDRSQSFSPTPDPDEFQRLSETHVILGREAMMLHPLRQTPAQTIWWDNGQFTGGADPDLLAWLNRHAFADRYVAQNRKLPARFAIKRFVPVSGSHTISALLQSELDHFRDPHWHSSRSSVLAAINGGFFLNFPEEYQHPWCAMNDPVGMMILGGCIRQLPLVARGAVLVSEDGQATIQAVSMADIALRLPWETSWRSHASSQAFAIDDPRSAGRQVTVFTPAFGALQPAGQQKTPLGDCVDFVVVFGELMESRIGGGCHIPANGIVISCPLADFPGEDVLALLQRHGRQIEFRFLHEKFTAQKIVTAVAAGPLLLQNGKFIAIDFFEQKPPPEQFVPARFDNGLSAQAGVAPTRFPHDADRTRAPRTILGVTPENRLLLAVIDGRARSHSLGATLQEAAGLARALGCTQALNLDGGGSSVLMFAPNVTNEPPLLPEIAKGMANVPSDDGHKDRLMPVPMMITGD